MCQIQFVRSTTISVVELQGNRGLPTASLTIVFNGGMRDWVATTILTFGLSNKKQKVKV